MPTGGRRARQPRAPRPLPPRSKRFRRTAAGMSSAVLQGTSHEVARMEYLVGATLTTATAAFARIAGSAVAEPSILSSSSWLLRTIAGSGSSVDRPRRCGRKLPWRHGAFQKHSPLNCWHFADCTSRDPDGPYSRRAAGSGASRSSCGDCARRWPLAQSVELSIDNAASLWSGNGERVRNFRRLGVDFLQFCRSGEKEP